MIISCTPQLPCLMQSFILHCIHVYVLIVPNNWKTKTKTKSNRYTRNINYWWIDFIVCVANTLFAGWTSSISRRWKTLFNVRIWGAFVWYWQWLELPKKLISSSSSSSSRAHHDWHCTLLLQHQQEQQTVGRVVSFYAFPHWGISPAAGPTGPIKKPALLIRAPRCTATLSMKHCPAHLPNRTLKKRGEKCQENHKKEQKEKYEKGPWSTMHIDSLNHCTSKRLNQKLVPINLVLVWWSTFCQQKSAKKII